MKWFETIINLISSLGLYSSCEDNEIKISKNKETPPYTTLMLYEDDIIVNCISGLSPKEDKEFFILLGKLSEIVNDIKIEQELKEEVVRRDDSNMNFINIEIKEGDNFIKAQYKWKNNQNKLKDSISKKISTLLTSI